MSEGVVAMANKNERWVWHRSGRYEYTPYRRNSTNPDHLVPSSSPSGPPLMLAPRYVAGRTRPGRAR
jgi:hypothetical protein